MVVDRFTRYVVTHQVFRAARGEANVLRRADLEREWRRTGLRLSDLDSALREAVARGYLVVSTTPRDYQLTGAGILEFGFPGTMLFDLRTSMLLVWRRLQNLVSSSGARPARDRRLAEA